MISTQQQAALAGANCEIAFDTLTRQLYATDASLYQIEPAAVAFPRSSQQASALVQAALQAGVSIIPRGAGTGLVGGAIGDGLVIDFSRYNRRISDLDLERKTVRVGPGVVLDALNDFLRPHGYGFGPDVATSARATLGGMIANNSSGAHVPAYGTTADHVSELELVTAEGGVVRVGPGLKTLRRQRELVQDLVNLNSLAIQELRPAGLLKRWPGYGIERCVLEPDNLNHLICGSEGTLGAITSAELKIVPLPAEKGMGLVFFATIAEAMQATVELSELNPAAIEHLDAILLDQTKGHREFQTARDLLELEQKPCQALLLVEFFEDVKERLEALDKRKLGMRHKILKTRAEADAVWRLRKAGLSLLTGRKGAAKPTTGIEDTAVRPRQLPEYVAALQSIMKRLGLEASYYGHAAAGLLHVRPVLDLHLAEDRKKFRQVADEVAALVRQFKGSLAAEHGVGMARSEYMPAQLGDGLLEVMREIKAAFDSNNVFNPGKVVPDGRFQIDANFRHRPDWKLKPGFSPVLAFAAKDGSFLANLEQCNGCGGCRKETPTMCPTFLVTGRELMSTRGRANTIRAALEGRLGSDWLQSPDLEEALSSCLSCKACTTECPSNVNLSLLKAELIHARLERDGVGLRERLFSSVDWLADIGCRAPGLANHALDSPRFRSLLFKLVGIASERPLPHYARQRFDRWFHRRKKAALVPNGRVLLWDDTFVRYHEPHIGQAAVKVLEAAGLEVVLALGRRCCGRPAFSQGHLSRATRLGQHNLRLLSQRVNDCPILFLEPSCYSMFVEDYRELGLADAESVARRCFLFEDFLDDLLSQQRTALQFKPAPERVVIHAHCHVKSLKKTGCLHRLAARLPGREVQLLNSGCCGMAGAFGALSEQYDLSLKIAEPLVRQVRNQPFGTVVVASGTSCRHQLEHLALIRPRHMAEALADALK